MDEASVKIDAQGYELLAPVWNAVREFVDMFLTGSVTLHFKRGKLSSIEKSIVVSAKV